MVETTINVVTVVATSVLSKQQDVMNPEDAKVIEQIRAAFPTEPIASEGAFAPWGNGYLDAEPYRHQLEGKAWDALDQAYIVRRSDALGFLGTRHLAAVLPVYLKALVEDGVWSPAAGMLTIILAKPTPTKDSGLGTERFDALVDELTLAQRTAVAATLRVLAEQDEGGSLGDAALSALDGYWTQYVSEAE